MKKLPHILVALSAVLLLGLTGSRIIPSWKYDSHLDHVAGVWVALALDLRRGLFYRAPFGPSGYGGTRFFPLYFCLHAAFMRVMNWRAAGYFLSAASVIMLLTGVYVLLRRLEVSRWLAFAAVLATLAGSSVQDSFLGIREDGMAAMLSVWGLALCVGREPSRRRIFLASLLFTLAFATKETSIAGAAAVFLWFLIAKRFRAAWQLLASTAAGYVVVLAAMYFASSGRAFAAFRFTLATGSDWQSLLYSPISMEQAMHGYVAETILLALGLAALVAGCGRGFFRLPSLWFLCTLAVALVIFSSDGTAGNHLIEVHVTAVVLLATWTSEFQLPNAGMAALAAACLLAWMELYVQHRDVDAIPVRAQLQQIVQAIGPTGKPILSDDPMVPITAGHQPYLLDAFMFRVIREDVPPFSDPMWQKLRERQFAAVVLMDNPDSDEGRDMYSNYHFGEDFIPLMRENYEPAGVVGGQYLFLPRTNLGSDAKQP
jgi:hypothetical protein